MGSGLTFGRVYSSWSFRLTRSQRRLCRACVTRPSTTPASGREGVDPRFFLSKVGVISGVCPCRVETGPRGGTRNPVYPYDEIKAFYGGRLTGLSESVFCTRSC